MRNTRAGLVSGLIATVVMDVVMVIVLWVMAMPVDTFLRLINESIGAFLGLLEIRIIGGWWLGLFAHYLIGLMLGLGFVSIVSLLPGFDLQRLIRTAVTAVIFTESASAFLLVPSVILLDISGDDLVNLTCMALFLHAMWGLSLAIAVRLLGHLPDQPPKRSSPSIVSCKRS